MLSKGEVEELYEKMGLVLKQKVPNVTTVCPRKVAKSLSKKEFDELW